MQPLLERLRGVNESLAAARKKQREQEARPVEPEAFAGPADLECELESVLAGLAAESFEFADVMRRLFPEFRVQPVQALDTPLVRPRAKLRCATDDGDGETVTLDLFEPPLHIRMLEPCLALRREEPDLSLRRIAGRLDVSYMTVKRALAYARRMNAEGATDPYRELHARPEQASRWKPRR